MKRFMIFQAMLMAVIAGCSPAKSQVDQPNPAEDKLPKVQREFRAAWIATVANINWPSKPGIPVEQQKAEAIALLDFLKMHNFNAAIFQIRPQADALYNSSLEPWSYYLTGEQGKAPSPYYDPLEFWVEEAHNRGIELHVWLNPYRAHHVSGGPVSDVSWVKKRPDLVHFLKEGYWWFDPSMKEVQDHGVAVVRDIVKRYDIDGVHFDDYFYPYASYNLNEDFPDSLSWNTYVAGGGKMSLGDWRRNSVNVFIERVYNEIKKEKKHVKFGLSPFGIWRPGYPESVGGFDQYEQLYADAKLWLNKGWIDYFTPQLYWPITRQAQSFPVLLGWWSGENYMKRHLWPGMSVGRDTGRLTVMETLNQIMITRGMLPESNGAVHWSISSVTRNTNLANALITGAYSRPALVPASPWLDNTAPDAPQIFITQKGDSANVVLSHTNTTDVFHAVIYYKYGSNWQYKVLNKNETLLKLPVLSGKEKLNGIAATAVDRTGNESKPKYFVPELTAIVPRNFWNAADAKPFKQHVPVRITVHHEGGRILADTANAANRLKAVQTWSMGPERNWADIPYHYLIAADGTVFEGRNVLTVGETNTEYDPTGHLLISFLGNYEQQEAGPELKEVLANLITHFCRQYTISPDSIATHRDYSKMTTCPGKNLYPWFEDGSLVNMVKTRLSLH